MSKNSNSAERLILVFSLSLFVLLVSLSFLPTGFQIGGLSFRPIDFAGDIRKTPVNDTAANQVAAVDSQTGTPTSLRPIPNYEGYKAIINYDATAPSALPQLARALQELQQGKRNKVRIAHIGDSFLEGDIITMELRRRMQAQYGGQGVGFVPMSSVIAGFRSTINHQFGGWQDQHLKSQGDKQQLFLSGHSFTAGSGARASYQGTKDSLLRVFEEVYAIYKGQPGGTFSVNGRQMAMEPLAVVKQRVADTAMAISASMPAGQTWFGFSMEPRRGVIVDNFPFRAIDGNEYRLIDVAWMQQIQAAMQYDLIILQYGPNLLWRPGSDKFGYYEGPMREAVSKLKAGFPGADILMITSGDKAFRYDGMYKTAKGLPSLLATQHRIADSAQVHFWNLYAAMGGSGTMISWVEAKPPLANNDYTHVNHRGGNEIGRMLYEAIMQAIAEPAAGPVAGKSTIPNTP